jgi:nucleotide-binding universal stress UspA family protein
VLIAIDDSEYAPIVLQHGMDLAGHRGAVDLHVVTVRAKDADLDRVKHRLLVQVADELDTFREVAKGWQVRLHVRTGPAPEEITDLAGELGADLIVLGRFGVHKTHRRLGNTAEQVLALAPCPTLVVQMVDRAPETAGCAACVATRRESGGERWFCAAHAAHDRFGMATKLLSSSMSWSIDGLRW